MARKQKSEEDLSEELCQKYVNEIDGATLDAGLSKREAAEVYKTVARELLARASGLIDEADHDDADESGDG